NRQLPFRICHKILHETPPSGKKRRYVTSGLQLNRSKSLVTQKRYEMERMILLITNKKSVIAFQDFGVHFIYDATWRRKRRFVTSGLQQNREKSLITEKRYEMERKLLLISNRKWVIAFQNPGLYLACAPPGGQNCVSSLPVYHKIMKNRL